MIAAVVAAVRDLVVAPQTTDTVTPENRVSTDDFAPQRVAVFAVGSTPVAVEVGGGVRLAHEVDVVLTIEHLDGPTTAGLIRDAIVTDLILRAVAVDWPNVPLGRSEFDTTTAPVVRYVEGAPDRTDALAAYAVLTFTVEATLRP